MPREFNATTCTQVKLATHSMAPSLSAFLSSARAACLHGSSNAAHTWTSFTIVLGNPSADLDSFISAVVYAYFCSASPQREDHKRLFIPLLNLPTTSARDLWRLRPEFGTALKLAQKPVVGQDVSEVSRDENNKGLLQQLVTVADVRSASKSTPISLFSDRPNTKNDYVLVDHNALTIPTQRTEDLSRHVNIIGCIDHHVDESYVPSNASPRIIRTGIGSCTSLVVQHLRDSQLWPVPDDGYATGELARLALAPILIDTINLTAEDKVSDTDRDAVAFLESCILSTSTSTSAQKEWNRKSFYDEIATTKANSLDLLTLPEIFGRDYKEWTESTKAGEKFTIGISSIARSITWLLEKAESVDEFLKLVHNFARKPDHNLDVFGMMTTSTSANGDFQRELLVIAFGATASEALKKFDRKAKNELHLKSWNESLELLDSMKSKLTDANGSSSLWWQQDVAKSRKQVAPLLREVVKEC
jgi:exopolyphosphatase